MKYPSGHKAKTRQGIIEAAQDGFKANGIAGTGLAAIMQRAGLTVGGYYAHFPSKQALVAEACALSIEESFSGLMAAAADSPRPLAALLELYLNPVHRDAHGQGCILAAAGSELAMQSPEVRTALTASLQANAERLAAWLPDGPEDERQQQALVIIASLVGTMVLARIVADEAASDRLAASDRILEATRRHLMAMTRTNEGEGRAALPQRSLPHEP